MVKDVNTLQEEIIQKITYNFLLNKMPTIKIFKQKVVLKTQQWGGRGPASSCAASSCAASSCAATTTKKQMMNHAIYFYLFLSKFKVFLSVYCIVFNK